MSSASRSIRTAMVKIPAVKYSRSRELNLKWPEFRPRPKIQIMSSKTQNGFTLLIEKLIFRHFQMKLNRCIWMFLNFFGINFHEQKILFRHLFYIQGQWDLRTTECERCNLKITIASFFWNLNLKSFVQSNGQVLHLGLPIVLDDKAIP